MFMQTRPKQAGLDETRFKLFPEEKKRWMEQRELLATPASETVLRRREAFRMRPLQQKQESSKRNLNEAETCEEWRERLQGALRLRSWDSIPLGFFLDGTVRECRSEHNIVLEPLPKSSKLNDLFHVPEMPPRKSSCSIVSFIISCLTFGLV